MFTYNDYYITYYNYIIYNIIYTLLHVNTDNFVLFSTYYNIINISL